MKKFLAEIEWAIKLAAEWRGSYPPEEWATFDLRIAALQQKVKAFRKAWAWFEEGNPVRRIVFGYKLVVAALK